MTKRKCTLRRARLEDTKRERTFRIATERIETKTHIHMLTKPRESNVLLEHVMFEVDSPVRNGACKDEVREGRRSKKLEGLTYHNKCAEILLTARKEGRRAGCMEEET